MNVFNLPASTLFGRNIPKNSFDAYVSNKQKKLFTDLIGRLTWTHKLAPRTINLSGKLIEEIQIIQIELKRKEGISELLAVINKSIPYAIIFAVQFGEQVYLSASAKHPHPTLADTSVLDWEFASDWFMAADNTFQLNLRESLDAVFFDLCKQLSAFASKEVDSMTELVEKSSKLFQLEKELKRFRSAVSTCKQFNKKVELNLELKRVEEQLDKLISDSI